MNPADAQKAVLNELTLANQMNQIEMQKLFEEFLLPITAGTKELTGSVQDEIQVSRHIMELEKSSDKQKAKTEIQAACDATRAAPSFELVRATTQSLFAGCSAILSIAGKTKLVSQVNAIGYAGLKLMDGGRMLATGTAMVGFDGALMLSPVAPYAAIAVGISSLLSLFDNNDGDNQLGEYLQQMYQDLSQQISMLHDHMMERFDHLEDKVDKLYADLVCGFLTYEQLRDFKADSRYSFECIEHELQTLHAINAKIDGLLLQPIIKSCSAIERYPSRFGSLESMEPKEVTEHFKTLEEGLLGIYPKHEFLNGHICADFAPQTVNRVLTSSEPGSLLGYLAQYNQTVLGHPLPTTIQPEKLPNLGLFTLALERYLALRSKTQVAYDDDCKAIAEIAHIGEDALTFIESVNKPLFEKLLAQYKANYDELLARFNEALDKKSTEVLDAVFSHALEVNKAAIDTFPVPYNSNGELEPGLKPSLPYNPYVVKEIVFKDLEWMKQNKDGFKLTLSLMDEQFLSKLDKTTLSCVTLTDCGCLFMTHFKSIIAKLIPIQVILAERLGLGIAEFITAGNHKPGEITMAFKKGDNTVLKLGTIDVFCDNCKPDPQALKVLDDLLVERRENLRNEALATLLAPTELGTRYQKAFSALQATYHLLKVYGTIAGFRADAMKAFLQNFNKHFVEDHSEQWLPKDLFNTINRIQVTQEKCFAANSTIIARFANANSMNNSFSKPLHIMLAKLGQFAVNHPEVVRRRNAEQARLTALAQREATERETALMQEVERLKKAAQQQELALAPRSAATGGIAIMQEVEHLRTTVTAMSTQMGSMESLLRQLLNKSTAQ